MSDDKPNTDGGTGGQPGEGQSNHTKVDRGARFHEATGGFDEVGKAFLVLLIVGLILYIWFLVL